MLAIFWNIFPSARNIANLSVLHKQLTINRLCNKQHKYAFFCQAIRVILLCRLGHIALQDGRSCNAIWPKRQTKTASVGQKTAKNVMKDGQKHRLRTSVPLQIDTFRSVKFWPINFTSHTIAISDLTNGRTLHWFRSAGVAATLLKKCRRQSLTGKHICLAVCKRQ